jgi:hypothetical protein
MNCRSRSFKKIHSAEIFDFFAWWCQQEKKLRCNTKFISLMPSQLQVLRPKEATPVLDV